MTYRRTTGQSVSLLSARNEPDAKRWAEARLDRSLLLLGDLTVPLRALARFSVLHAESSQRVRGLAVKFNGFDIPVSSIVADDEDAAGSLLAAVRDLRGYLVVSSEQKLPRAVSYRIESTDPWMVAVCEDSTETRSKNAEAVRDPVEMEDFLRVQGMRFWSPSMFRFGHTFGVRSVDGRLICAGGVNFVLEDLGYAHIGPIVTDAAERGRSFGSQVLAAMRCSLASAGIRHCGLFADGADPGLVRYYVRHGFDRRGEFHFLKALPGS